MMTAFQSFSFSSVLLQRDFWRYVLEVIAADG